MGLGAGWQEREHDLFGFELLDLRPRFDRFEEGVEVITRLLRERDPVTFQGEYYNLNDAVLLPRPEWEGRPPVLIGGNGRNRTIPLAASLADEWNGVFIGPEKFQELNLELTNLITKTGRDPAEVRRSVMTGLVFASNPNELGAYLEEYGEPAEELKSKGVIVGLAECVQEQIQAYAEAGAQKVMLQWLDLENLEGLHALADAVL